MTHPKHILISRMVTLSKLINKTENTRQPSKTQTHETKNSYPSQKIALAILSHCHLRKREKKGDTWPLKRQDQDIPSLFRTRSYSPFPIPTKGFHTACRTPLTLTLPLRKRKLKKRGHAAQNTKNKNTKKAPRSFAHAPTFAPAPTLLSLSLRKAFTQPAELL